MAHTLAKSHSPAETQVEVTRRWDEAGAFAAEPSDPGEPYCIVIPPPNVTAALHLGHALNNTLQDVLIRAARLRGHNTLWMPGTDHAGIATQTVVEKRLLPKKRTDFTREAFIEHVQAWKDEYEATIIAQLKAMGCSCDWRRVRFTMDPVCTRAVREAFYLLFADGLIERGKRLVNWDPVTLTALADDEVEMQTVEGHMWYLRYPLVPADGARDEGTEGPRDKGGEYVTVATTRPETMLGDTAVAVNPKDPRAAALRGRRVRLPIVDREVPIVEDDYVVMAGQAGDPKAEYATGFLKVTPAHDPNDWQIGERHGLAVINVMAPDGSISADHGWRDHEEPSPGAAEFLGLSRDEARERIVEWFRSHGLLEEIRPYRHDVGHSYRSHAPIEPYLSDQWYVRVTDDRMRGEALRAMAPEQRDGAPPKRDSAAAGREGDGDLRFHPARYARTFQAWHENLRDWCISRQLWWGHRIPVWTADPERQPPVTETGGGRKLLAEKRIAEQRGDLHYVCVRGEDDREAVEVLERAGYAQDPDVLDTWFSSALWPISTMGWPDPSRFPDTEGLLEAFNPSSVLVTARDIITLWVSRMVMFNRYLRDGRLPFRDVYINPMIQDGHGQRMSKSLGNGVDPREIIDSHGADALRFVMVDVATSTQDARMPVDLLCPHCGATVHPAEMTSPAGYRVAEPVQTCPACRKTMTSGYGAATGATGGGPLAKNTSDRFDRGRNFANKLWNATRFSLGQLAAGVPGPQGVAPASLPLVDRWMISRLHGALRTVEGALEKYQFSVYGEAIYDLVWADFCDWYLEAIKPTAAESPAQRQTLRTVLDCILRVVHPVCPFVTEALWPHLQATGPAGIEGITCPGTGNAPLARAAWPLVDDGVVDEEAVVTFGREQELVKAIRNLKSEHQVPPKRKIDLYAPGELTRLVASAGGVVEHLAGLARVEPLGAGAPPAGTFALAFEGRELRLGGLVEAVDRDTERARLEKLRDQKGRAVENLRGRLANRSYVEKAPGHLVEQTRAQLAEAEADLAAAERALEDLEAACSS